MFDRTFAARSAALASVVLAGIPAHAQQQQETTVIHLESSSPSVFLQRLDEANSRFSFASQSATSSDGRVRASVTTISESTMWAPACAVPCGIALPRAAVYRAYGAAGSPLFQLPAEATTLRLHEGSVGRVIAGAFSVSLGGLLVVTSATFAGVAATNARFAEAPLTIPLTATSGASGAILTALGGWLIYAGLAHVDDLRTGRRLARAITFAPDGVHF